MRPARSPRGAPTGRAAIVLAAVLVAATNGPVEDLATVDDGAYRGRLVLSGSAVQTDGGGQAVSTLEVSGPLEIQVERGASTGAWSMSGTGLTHITDPNGMDLTIDHVHEASGEVSGDQGAARMTGEWIHTRTFRLPDPFTETESFTFSSPLTDVLHTCDRMVGRFERGLVELTEAASGATLDATGSFVLVREPSNDEVEQRLDQLAGVMSRAIAGLSGAQQLESRALELSWVAIIRDAVVAAAEVAASLEGPSPCPAGQQQYLELAADLALRGLQVLQTADAGGAAVPTQVLREATIAAVSTGVTSRAEGQQAVDGIREVVRQRWGDATSGEFDLDDPELLRLAGFAAEMGWSLPASDGGEIPARDVLVLLGDA